MMQVEALTQKYTHLGPDTLAYAHFCQAFDDRTLSPLRFVTNLSQRLANRYPFLATALLQSSSKEVHITASQTVGTVEPGGSVAGIMIEAVQVGNLSARVAFDELVRRPLEYLSPRLQPDHPHPRGRAGCRAELRSEDNIVTLLAHTTDRSSSLPPQMRFLLTTRHDPRVLSLMDGVTLDLIRNAPEGAEEVRAYAYTRLSALPESKRTDVAERVAEAAQGISSTLGICWTICSPTPMG